MTLAVLLRRKRLPDMGLLQRQKSFIVTAERANRLSAKEYGSARRLAEGRGCRVSDITNDGSAQPATRVEANRALGRVERCWLCDVRKLAQSTR